MGWKFAFIINVACVGLNVACFALDAWWDWWPGLVVCALGALLCSVGAWGAWQSRPKGSAVL